MIWCKPNAGFRYSRVVFDLRGSHFLCPLQPPAISPNNGPAGSPPIAAIEMMNTSKPWSKRRCAIVVSASKSTFPPRLTGESCRFHDKSPSCSISSTAASSHVICSRAGVFSSPPKRPRTGFSPSLPLFPISSRHSNSSQHSVTSLADVIALVCPDGTFPLSRRDGTLEPSRRAE